MKRKKLLISLTYYTPNISGVTQYASVLARELSERGHLVRIVTSKFKKELKESETKDGILIKRIKGFGLGKGFVMPLFPLQIIKDVYWSDIVNLHLPSIESFWTVCWAKILGKKIIVTHHCEFNFGGTFGNKVISLLTYPFHLLVYFLADNIAAYTEDYAKTSIFLRLFLNKVRYIFPPIVVDDSGKKFDFGKDKVVGYVGRVGWEKGLQHLIKAMEKIDAKLVILGPYKQVIGDKTYEKLKKLISKKVIFYGPTKLHGDLKGFYERCDCLVLPSTNNLETFGLVQVEAMLSGTPVVASDLPGVKMPVTITKFGEISRVGDAEDIANKVNLVLKRGKNYYQKRATNLEVFDLKKAIAGYEKIF